MNDTPWGYADHVKQLADGVIWASTPSHGGIGVRIDVANRMSEPAQRRGERVGDYLWYEEDCDWAIPAHELSHIQEKLSACIEEIIYYLSNWNPIYLFEIGLGKHIDLELWHKRIEQDREWHEDVRLQERIHEQVCLNEAY